MAEIEHVALDHNQVTAPYVRIAGVEHHPQGCTVQKYDLRFLQPNEDAIPTAALHTLEHLLAIYLRDELEGVIDVSPMGCRTGFYLIKWDEHEPEVIGRALGRTLQRILETDEVPDVTQTSCGNYKDHSLFAAKEYAKIVLEKGIRLNPFKSKPVSAKAVLSFL